MSEPQKKDLATLEQEFRQRCETLFARVDAKVPEKGVRALLKRARKRRDQAGLSYEAALEREYEEARQRTEARIALLSQCALKPPPSTGG